MEFNLWHDAYTKKVPMSPQNNCYGKKKYIGPTPHLYYHQLRGCVYIFRWHVCNKMVIIKCIYALVKLEVANINWPMVMTMLNYKFLFIIIIESCKELIACVGMDTFPNYDYSFHKFEY